MAVSRPAESPTASVRYPRTMSPTSAGSPGAPRCSFTRDRKSKEKRDIATHAGVKGLVVGDLDNDGCIDIAINCNDGPAVILRNQGGTVNHWLLINLVGSVSNRDGFGARVHVISEQGLEQHAFASSAGSYLSASDNRVRFGLGASRKVRLLEINWPSGIVQQINSVDTNQIITVREPNR